MIEVPVAVKNHFLDPFLETFLSNQFSDFLRRIHIPRRLQLSSKLRLNVEALATVFPSVSAIA